MAEPETTYCVFTRKEATLKGTKPHEDNPLEGTAMPASKLEIRGVDVSKIINRNEKRVANYIPEVIDEYYQDYIFEDLDIQDIYALTLNLIPAGYAQQGSIVLSDRLSSFEIKSKIRTAIERVLENPTRSER